jgi:DMSO/TMAO reductase YedYZ molybdopterin-dependent catalytic subunit
MSIGLMNFDSRLSRRGLLQLAAAGVPALAGLSRVPWAWGQTPSPIVKPLPPESFTLLGTNAEMRWDAAAGLAYAIPNERFFVRNHTSTPLIDPATYRLNVFGSGLRRPEGVSFSLRDLERMPSRSLTAFIECAGNGRSFFGSQQGTPAWRAGAACRSARYSSARALRAGRSTSCPRASIRRSARQATCAGRSRWRRRSTTSCSPTR